MYVDGVVVRVYTSDGKKQTVEWKSQKNILNDYEEKGYGGYPSFEFDTYFKAKP